MARFYKTSQPNRIDFMYEMPANLMMKVIENTDARNDELNNQLNLFNDALLKVNYLEPDRERTQQITNQYKTQVDQLAQSISDNPQNWRKYMGQVRNLGRQLTDDYSRGELAAIQGNYNNYIGYRKTHEEMLKKGEITPDQYRLASQNFMNRFSQSNGTGYDPETGTFNQFESENLYKTPDFNKITQGATDKIKSDLQAQGYSFVSGQWIREGKNGVEVVTPDRVAQIANDALMANPEVSGYLRQGSRLGYTPNYTDKNGNIIQPYRVTNGQIEWLYDSPQTRAIRSVVGSQSFTKKSSEAQTKENPYAMEATRQANRLTLQDDSQQHDKDMEGIKHEEAKELEGIRQNNRKELEEFKQGLRATSSTPATKKVAAKGIGKSSANTNNIQLVGDQFQLGFDQSTYFKDIEQRALLDAAITQAEKSGNINLRNQLLNQRSDINSTVQRAKEIALTNLRSAGFNEAQIQDYVRYRNDPAYKEQLRRQGQLAITPGLMGDAAASETMRIRTADPVIRDAAIEKGMLFNRMNAVFNKSVNDWYNNEWNTRKVVKQGITIDDTMSDVKEAVNDYITANSEKVTFIDPQHGEPARVNISKKLASGRKIEDIIDLQSIVPINGSAFKVNVDGKEYLMKFSGNTNMDYVLYNKFKNSTDPLAQEFSREIYDPYRKAVLYNTDDLVPGVSKTFELNLPDYEADPHGNVTYKANIQMKQRSDNSERFDALVFDPSSKKFVPLIENVTREGVADFIAEQVMQGK